MNEVQLTQQEITTYTNYVNNGKHPEAYQYLADRINTRSNLSQDIQDLTVWLVTASKINNSTNMGFSNQFVRLASYSAYLQTPEGKAEQKSFDDWDKKKFQPVSDFLSTRVLKKLQENNFKITDTTGEVIIKEDVSSAVTGLGLPTHGWAGSAFGWLPTWAYGLGLDGKDSQNYDSLWVIHLRIGDGGASDGDIIKKMQIYYELVKNNAYAANHIFEGAVFYDAVGLASGAVNTFRILKFIQNTEFLYDKNNNVIGVAFPEKGGKAGAYFFNDNLTTQEKLDALSKTQFRFKPTAGLQTDINPDEIVLNNVNVYDNKGGFQIALKKSLVDGMAQTNDLSVSGVLTKIAGESYYFLEKAAVLTIDGVDYTAGAIVEAGEIAYDALSDFLKGNYKNNIISNALSNALNNTFADIAGIIANGGTVDGTKILQTFAKRTGYAFIASSITQTTAARELTVHLNGGEIQTINNTSYIKLKDGTNIATNAEQKVDANDNIYYEGKNSNGQTVTATEAELSLGGTGKAAISGLLNFGIQAAFEGQNWNSSDYLENGTITVGSAIASQFIVDNFSSKLGGSTNAAGVAAATTTIIAGIIKNPHMSSGEYAMLGAQAGIAAGSVIGGMAVAEALKATTYSALYGALAINPVALAVGVVISVVLNSVLNKAIGGVHLNPGETQTLNAAEDQLWKFAKLGIKETDSNGVENTVLKDAIYVTNADGVTLDKQAMLDSRSVFRVFNGTVATNTAKANFKPTYLLGGQAADNIIGNGDSETLYGYDGSDFLDARGGNNSVIAGKGNDVVLAGLGRDFIDAGDGNDFVEVEGGDNIIVLGNGDDRLYAGNGNDVINAGNGSDVINAGHGDNIIILGNPTLADDGAIISDTDVSRNEVYAGYGRDNITGSGGRDTIIGDYLDDKAISDLNALGDGKVKSLGYLNDTIRAGDGGDLVMAGVGQDTIYGGKGNDVLIGGSDLADYTLLEFVPSDIDFIYGEAGDDIILGDSVDDFGTEDYVNYGTDAFNENLLDDNQRKPGLSPDYIDGGIGNDYIDGGNSDDTIIGGLGHDVLFGGRKHDVITDGEGHDYIIGGIGNDTLISVGDIYSDYFMFGATDAVDVIKGANKNDSIYFNANLRADATFKRVDNNLVITLKGTAGTVVTVENHFNGNAIGTVVFSNNNRYHLSNTTAFNTANGGTLNPTYLDNNSANRFIALGYRLDEFEADYKDGTSAFAVNEHSTWYDTNYYTETQSSNIDAETFNGIEIAYEKRKRGWFGGHYSVFKQVKDTVLNGTNISYTEQEGYHYTVSPNYDEFNDFIVGAWWGETIKGLDGDDIIFAGGGNDTVDGGDGNDFINGGDGDDILAGDGANSGTEAWHYEYDQYSVNGYWDNYTGVIEQELETAHDLIFGGAGNDTVNGGFGNDTLYGDSGNDIINGDSGDDNIDGGSGHDSITDTNSYAIIDGGTGNDALVSGNFEDLLWGGEGNDSITSGSGDDVIFADEGDDRISLGAGTDFAHGGDGNDVIYGGSGNDIIHGGDGTDSLYGSTGKNMLIGGYGDDLLYSTGKDTLIGGSGNKDVASYTYETNEVIINLAGTKSNGYQPIYEGRAFDDTFDSIERYYGSNYNDILIADNLGRVFRGYGGDDTLIGGTGNDNLSGGDGNDKLIGADGHDILNGDLGNDKIYANNGNDFMYGGEGNDTFYFGSGTQTADGGEGTDALVYYYSQTGVKINLGTQIVSGGEATDDIIAGFENAYGSNYNDTIYGTSGVNILGGYAGNDFLQGYAGNDALNGGAGEDTIDGGLGTDTLSYSTATSGISFDLSLGSGSRGDALGDSVENIENVNGSNYDDVIIGDDFNNIIKGTLGNDTLHGRAGKDTIYGGDGNDVLHSGANGDKLYGGAGSDIFEFSKFNSIATDIDIIYDFVSGEDKLSLAFANNIANVLIQASAGFNVVSVADTSFVLQVSNTITLNDVILVAAS